LLAGLIVTRADINFFKEIAGELGFNVIQPILGNIGMEGMYKGFPISVKRVYTDDGKKFIMILLCKKPVNGSIMIYKRGYRSLLYIGEKHFEFLSGDSEFDRTFDVRCNQTVLPVANQILSPDITGKLTDIIRTKKQYLKIYTKANKLVCEITHRDKNFWKDIMDFLTDMAKKIETN